MKKFAVEPVPTPMIGAGGHVFDRGAGDRLLEFVLGHRGIWYR